MRIFLGNFENNHAHDLGAALEWTGLSAALARASKVFLKPNFTFPQYTRGVTTSPAFLRDVLATLSESVDEVFVGESNGGYGSFLASEAFAGHGLLEICKETQTTPMNLSEMESRIYSQGVNGKTTSVRLPRFLVEDVDLTVSMPVLKVHAMTTVSLSVKNLWGCCPVDLRLLQHAQLARKLRLIAELTKARFGVIDAFYGLDNHGPMEGDARLLGRYIVGDDLYGLDFLTARMMGFDPNRIQHLGLISPNTRGDIRRGRTVSNEDVATLDWGFRLCLNLVDALSLACFHSDTLAKVVFDSPMTKPIYAIIGRQPRRRLGTPPR